MIAAVLSFGQLQNSSSTRKRALITLQCVALLAELRKRRNILVEAITVVPGRCLMLFAATAVRLVRFRFNQDLVKTGNPLSRFTARTALSR